MKNLKLNTSQTKDVIYALCDLYFQVAERSVYYGKEELCDSGLSAFEGAMVTLNDLGVKMNRRGNIQAKDLLDFMDKLEVMEKECINSDMGYPMDFDSKKEEWVYSDTKQNIKSYARNCKRCGKARTEKGHDSCISDLGNVLNACCGHGSQEGYIQFDNGITIRGWFEVERDSDCKNKQEELLNQKTYELNDEIAHVRLTEKHNYVSNNILPSLDKVEYPKCPPMPKTYNPTTCIPAVYWNIQTFPWGAKPTQNKKSLFDRIFRRKEK